MQLAFTNGLPAQKPFIPGIRRAPSRGFHLTKDQTVLALRNALRYIPSEYHAELIPEFLDELRTMGRIYGYRFRPEGNICARPVHEYRGKILHGKALQLMIDNNLDFAVALYPYELVTYGETGQVCQNWMQYLLIKRYLEMLDVQQTLVVSSGHPLGLFPSRTTSPRVISTNGLMVGIYDNPKDFALATALGVANYGQMTAGGWMYIGPQGIVHGTYITLLNAGRKFLGIPAGKDLSGKLFVSSGLGGMSGAQAKAIEIAGGIGVIAEVDFSRIATRQSQGWVQLVSTDPQEISRWIDHYKREGTAISIAYHGNIVDLLEYFVAHNVAIDLLSDQTSCHAAYDGGYTPQGLSFAESRACMLRSADEFRKHVNHSLGRHFRLVQSLHARGTYFWDYGNSFMKAVYDAGFTDIARTPTDERNGFVFPSYVEDIMGPLCFDRGYGPFRWVCLSGLPEDLKKSDDVAMSLLDPNSSELERDNYCWIRDAAKNNLVVGSQARILYADAVGRVRIALALNNMVRSGEIGPIMLGRDHHDVSGTDSPFRETANIKDGSNMCADMAVQCFAGDAARGMTLVVESNGGGVGIGKSVNGGFGLVLDGTPETDETIKLALDWDVMGGVARRAWAGNTPAIETVQGWNNSSNSRVGTGEITLPFIADEKLLHAVITL